MSNDSPVIRPETPADILHIHAVEAAAFETDAEARLVDALRAQCAECISLVAELNTRIVGHILFSPVTLDGAAAAPHIMGLAPVAVHPDFQRKEIGARLIREGLDRCRTAGYEGVVVLGHRDYYPRFGFVPSVRFGFKSTYDVPEEVFMALELVPGAFANAPGAIARYHAAFDAL